VNEWTTLHRRLWRALGEDCQGLHPRLRLLQAAAGLIPIRMGGRSRTVLLRAAGVRAGAGTLIFGAVDLHGAGLCVRRLSLGKRVQIGPHCSIDLSADVQIEDDVEFGHHVVIITAEHGIGGPHHRCGMMAPRPVVVRRGAWIGARTTVLPGVTIGEGSVVGAGSAVYHDVPPHTLVAGSPARAVRRLSDGCGVAAPADAASVVAPA
jgi:acetyltransferase-like isoleucine patch superfamily enzyme